MVDPLALTAGAAFIALLIGFFLGWFVQRGKASALSAAAAADARAGMLGELATLTERTHALTAALAAEREQRVSLQRTADGDRQLLDAASNEIARLSERAKRVAELESELASLGTALKARDAELLQVSTAHGQQTERAIQLAQQLSETTLALTHTRLGLEKANRDLQQANEARAAFEQQALRVPALERQLADTDSHLSTVRDELSQLREAAGRDSARRIAELASEREALASARHDGETHRLAAAAAEARLAALMAEHAELKTRTEDERIHAAEKLQMLTEAKESLSAQFKSLANDILEEKSKRFAEQNQTTLGQLLDPLRSQLSEFKGKVEEVYVQEGKDRSALSEQVRQLVALNQTLSEDAKRLTQALKGQAKTQGNWGELILERVLEASGLRKGFEYKVQDSQVRDDGSRAMPDVVIELPEDRKLVVDAKVSLVAYERFVSATTDEERNAALRQHQLSVREHIKGLSGKNYHQLYGLQSMDFVLAFIPVEPAFMVAVTSDDDLFMDAWQRNVLLVSPSTLLFVVRTVAHLWRQESQKRNAQEISRRGAALYDKLVAFVGDLQKVGERLGQARTAYDEAQSRLVSGNGNLIRQAQMLVALGVKPSKQLPRALADAASPEGDLPAPVPGDPLLP